MAVGSGVILVKGYELASCVDKDKKLRHEATITGNIYLMHTTCQDKFLCFVCHFGYVFYYERQAGTYSNEQLEF